MSQHHDLIQQSTEYRHWLLDVKSKIAGTQIKAALLVNHELIRLYWYLGQQIVSKQTEAKWGSSFIDQFSKDLKADFPGSVVFQQKICVIVVLFINFIISLQFGNKLLPN